MMLSNVSNTRDSQVFMLSMQFSFLVQVSGASRGLDLLRSNHIFRLVGEQTPSFEFTHVGSIFTFQHLRSLV